jgi:GMP reductase
MTKNKKFDFNDIQIIPEVISEISSRSECDPYINGKLPIFAAPMYDVINEDNVDVFNDNSIFTILPRNSKNTQNKHFDFYAFGLNDEIVVPTPTTGILIDIANGHMKSLIDRIKEIKTQFPTNPLMVGNIARPETYLALTQAGADYIRVSIGSGQVCTTAANIGIGYPIASLIEECREIKVSHGLKSMIVADGGMKSYPDIIKALALGADFVMAGGIFAKSTDSAGEKFLKYINGDKYIPLYEVYPELEYKKTINIKLYDTGVFEKNIYGVYRGMSTKEAQQMMGNKVLKTSEGVKRYFKLEYSIQGWVENFDHYLRSAMSYTNSRILEEFKESQYVFITGEAFKRFNK